jgi:DNA-binding winged helix-turn-helix (wHTH) protein
VDCLRSEVAPGGRPEKIFDTLLLFVERAGQLLGKRMLIEALWPNVVVEESNLTQTIHTLRRLLSERPDDHRYIVTVPGRGYRFVAQVTNRILEEPQSTAVEPTQDPLAAVGRSNLGGYLAAVGEWEEAIREFEKARELSPTLNALDSDIARVQILRHRFDEAFSAIGRVPAGPLRDHCVALTYRAPGQRAAADAARGAGRCAGTRCGARDRDGRGVCISWRQCRSAQMGGPGSAADRSQEGPRMETGRNGPVALPQGAACRRALEHSDRQS